MAVYLMGAQKGKSKESGNEWFKITLLLFDSFGVPNTKFFFVPSKVFKQVEKYSLSCGYPVIPSYTVNGDKLALKGLRPDESVPVLELVPDDSPDDGE